MKMSLNYIKGYLFFILALCLTTTYAQQIKVVSGKVVNKDDKKPFASEAVFIYAFNTIAEAEDAKVEIDNQSGKLLEAVSYELADESGYYEIRVPDNGALIFKVGLAPCVLEKVNRRMEIDVSIDAGILMENVSIVGMLQDIRPLPQAPTMIGNKLVLYNTFPIPAQFGKENGRLIIQPIITDCQTNDTVAYGRPLIYDGIQYQLTQKRRMRYNPENDPLYKFVNEQPLISERMNIEWADTVLIPDPTSGYFSTATILLEDYTHVYYNKTYQVTTCNMKRPLKFLEYSTSQYDLDPEKYRVRARREKRNTGGNISLTFLVAKAELDPNNPENTKQMDKLKSDLLDIVNGEGTTLKEFHITGISSPEGNYQTNLSLAQRRVAFAQSQITSVIPGNILSRVYQNPQAKVAPWSEVADLLEKDSLNTYAREIRSIIESAPGNYDRQFSQIARLPYYQSTIKEYLPKLRSVEYQYIHEIFRELTPEEIYERYLHDEDYNSGKKEFALYEYWHLFNMEKNPLKLEGLYRRAYEASKQTSSQPWILAANNLAVSYLKRDTFDISVLDPFIDRKTKGTNIVRKRIDGVTEETINPEEIIANQLAMYLKANNFEEASVMAQILPDAPEYQELRSFAMCLGGYYRGGNTPEEQEMTQKVFETVKNSSPINEVVMYLALDTRRGDVLAERAAANLPENNPVSWYLKAIINNRKGEVALEDTKNCLIECFKLDEQYIHTASIDGDIDEGTFEYTMDMYELYKDLNPGLNELDFPN